MIEMDDVLGALWLRLGLGEFPDTWGIDWALPAIEALVARSTSIMLKLDGERERLPWTIVISGGVLGEEFFRTDQESASAALILGLWVVALEGNFE
jgi:hypothetical protein